MSGFRKLWDVCVGREPVSEHELADAEDRVAMFLGALEAGDEGAKAALRDFVKSFEGPVISPTMLLPTPPRRRRTVVT